MGTTRGITTITSIRTAISGVGTSVAPARRRDSDRAVARRLALASALLACVTAACGGSRYQPLSNTATETGPGTLAQARQYLEGSWELLSFEVRPPGREPLRLQGSGTLTYDAFGNLAMEIRVDEATADILDRAGIPTTKGVIATSGRTAVDMQARTLTYVLDQKPVPLAPVGPLALSRPRHWEVDGQVLTLTTRGDDGEPLSVGRWQKMP